MFAVSFGFVNAQVDDRPAGGVVIHVDFARVDAGDDDGVAVLVADVVEVAGAGAGAFVVVDLLEVEVVLGDAGGGLAEEFVGGDVLEISRGEIRGVEGDDELGVADVLEGEQAAVLGGGVGEVVEAFAVEFVDR